MARKTHFFLFLSILVISGALGTAQIARAASQTPQPVALVLTASGALTPAMEEYLKRGITTAEQQNDTLLVFQLNTPGGSLDLLNKMIEDIRGSTVPVVVYVAPRGAMAGSAGTIITLAGHAAAMAPETAIGAASVVGPQGQNLDSTEQAKVTEIMKATVRSLAARRPPAAIALAEDTIQNAKAVSNQEAKQIGLIDFIASDVPDLLNQLDGFTVVTKDGTLVLDTRGIQSVPLNNTLIEIVLGWLTDPNIVFLLLTIGVQAILIELASPGGWVAGFIGVVSLALAGYGLGILPVNWFGIAFLIMAFVLFILDIKAPTHGALTVAGVVSFIVGGLVLFNSPGVPSFQRVSVPLVVAASLVMATFFFIILTIALRAQKTPLRMGSPQIVGKTGVVRATLNPVGTVQVSGELWTARAEGDAQLMNGTPVTVVGVQGTRLSVRPVGETITVLPEGTPPIIEPPPNPTRDSHPEDGKAPAGDKPARATR